MMLLLFHTDIRLWYRGNNVASSYATYYAMVNKSLLINTMDINESVSNYEFARLLPCFEIWVAQRTIWRGT